MSMARTLTVGRYLLLAIAVGLCASILNLLVIMGTDHAPKPSAAPSTKQWVTDKADDFSKWLGCVEVNIPGLQWKPKCARPEKQAAPNRLPDLLLLNLALVANLVAMFFVYQLEHRTARTVAGTPSSSPREHARVAASVQPAKALNEPTSPALGIAGQSLYARLGASDVGKPAKNEPDVTLEPRAPETSNPIR